MTRAPQIPRVSSLPLPEMVVMLVVLLSRLEVEAKATSVTAISTPERGTTPIRGVLVAVVTVASLSMTTVPMATVSAIIPVAWRSVRDAHRTEGQCNDGNNPQENPLHS